MTPCDVIRERLHEAPPPGDGRDADVAAHLAGCDACRAEAEALDALAARVREAFDPTLDPAAPAPAPPPLEAVLAAARARAARPGRLAAGVARAAALLLAAALGALADRALVRAPDPGPAVTTPAPPAPTLAPPPRLPAAAHDVVAARPGGLAASLALLDALSQAPPAGGAR